MAAKPKTQSAYAKAGVDIEKADKFVGAIADMVKTTLNDKVAKSIGGYAALYQLGVDEFIAATTDGVGTKLKLAFELGRHDTVGIDLVAMSVNDLICVGAKPLFFLDYFAIGKLDLKTSRAVIKGIVEGCRQGKLALIGGETAEMPGIYQKGEYDLAGFAVGLVSREQLIDGSRVRPGDVILGIESSGPHSNGFSLIRKLLQGKTKDAAMMKACLAPTRIYVDPITALHHELGPQLKGLAHITGSGFLNIPRINDGVNYDIVLPDSFEMPKVFQELQKRGKLSWTDLYTTFNMGFGMIAVVESVLAVRAQNVLERMGVKSH
ncbi:MAG: phosphoribosylformylglycinamidine cyclo-ligase, partial [Deltaproteobacteria bacterium]|nr:phosphoribosylformylglycinamidine cyclo-ligase [Deltaproteobacteria bacterium]